jgi:hypothetical protein
MHEISQNILYLARISMGVGSTYVCTPAHYIAVRARHWSIPPPAGGFFACTDPPLDVEFDAPLGRLRCGYAYRDKEGGVSVGSPEPPRRLIVHLHAAQSARASIWRPPAIFA